MIFMELENEKLARWLSNPSPEEKRELEIWLSQSDKNKGIWASYLKIWEDTEKLYDPLPQPDKGRIWNNIHQEIQEKKPKRKFSPLGYAAAAVLALIMVFSYLFFNRTSIQLFEAKNGHMEILLPDSSKVILRKNAKLIVSNGFGNVSRTVELEGDAFFEVKRNQQKPFLVQTESHFVKVLGTSFLIQTSQPDEATVSVFSGKVEFGIPSGQSSILTKDMSLTILGDQFVEKEKSANDLAWWTGELKYDNAPLSQFVADMQYNFGIEVKVSTTSLMDCGLTAKFEGLTPDEMVQAVAMTFGSELKRTSKSRVVIQGGNCETGG